MELESWSCEDSFWGQIFVQINRYIAECFDFLLFLTCIILNTHKTHGGLFEVGGVIAVHAVAIMYYEKQKKYSNGNLSMQKSKSNRKLSSGVL